MARFTVGSEYPGEAQPEQNANRIKSENIGILAM
jgi:hypothetical protein